MRKLLLLYTPLRMSGQNTVLQCSKGTNRVRYDTAFGVLDQREDLAGHQTRGGAAEDSVITYVIFHSLENMLLSLEVLKNTLLTNKPNTD